MDGSIQDLIITRLLLNSGDGRIVSSQDQSASQANANSGISVPPNAPSTSGQTPGGYAKTATDANTAASSPQPSTSQIITNPLINSLKFSLNRSFIDVIHVDWTFTTGLISPCYCSITELEQNGLTLNGNPYWKFLYGSNSNVNAAASYLPIRPTFPRTFNTLTVQLFGQDGAPLVQRDSWSIELLIYSLPVFSP